MRKRVLFGAGVYARKYAALLDYIGLPFDYFADNDPLKWGGLLFGRPIIPPAQLPDLEEPEIIISCTDKQTIQTQLSSMQFPFHLVQLNELYRQFIQAAAHPVRSASTQHPSRAQTIFVEMYEGMGWAGTEQWASDMALALHKAGLSSRLLGREGQTGVADLYRPVLLALPETDQNPIDQMVRLFEQSLPMTLINNFAGIAMLAACAVKQQHPDQVTILSVIHNDNQGLYQAHFGLEPYIDKFFCISDRIRQAALCRVSNPKKLYGRAQPIPVPRQTRAHSSFSGPIRLGYGGRLARQQKRSDLLPVLIHHLEQLHMDYLFQIAGDGECLDEIRQFIAAHNLQNRVQLLGRLPKSAMTDFWLCQHVFINLSEYEGASLAMLEAMACGCVPIVTDVSGARDFIDDTKNGYVCPIGDPAQIAARVSQLDQNRDVLQQFSQICRSIIAERCNPDLYLNYWLEQLLT